MSSVRKAPSGRWRAEWREPGGRKRSKTFDRRSDAKRFLDGIGADMARGLYLDPSLARTPFDAWVREWRPTTLHLRPSSQARMDDVLATHILPHFGARPIGSIRTNDVRAFVASLSAAGLAPASVRKVYNGLRSILKAAEASGLIGRSPCLGIDLPPLRRTEMRFLTAPELSSLAGTVGPRFGPLILTAGYMGLRWGELAGLKRERVRLLDRRIDVTETITEVGGRLHAGPPKTGDRTVTLPGFLAQIVGEHIGRYPDPLGFVFGSTDGGPLRRSNFGRRHFQPAVRRAGLAPLRLHDLRHTAAALAIAEGAHPLEIKTRLGHKNITTTLNEYGHLFPALDERLAERLDATYRAAEADALAACLPPEAPSVVVALPDHTIESSA
jgi:integrase